MYRLGFSWRFFAIPADFAGWGVFYRLFERGGFLGNSYEFSVARGFHIDAASCTGSLRETVPPYKIFALRKVLSHRRARNTNFTYFNTQSVGLSCGLWPFIINLIYEGYKTLFAGIFRKILIVFYVVKWIWRLLTPIPIATWADPTPTASSIS